jgi:serine/threonine protein kinase
MEVLMSKKAPLVFETIATSYTEVGFLGEGGSGQVLEVEDEDGKPFALKMLRPHGASTAKRKRFRNEISFCSRCTHPNVIQVLDSGFTAAQGEKAPFYVMKRYHHSLRDLLSTGIGSDSRLPLFSKIIDGVEAAHLMNVIHRDLKPENILCDEEGEQMVIADFGVAHFTEEIIVTAVETKATDRLANFRYCAPEQKQPGQEIGAAADIFALGLILHEMFTGEVPHGTDYIQVCSTAPEYGYLDSLVHDMLRQNPSDRPSSIATVRSELIALGNEYMAQQKISEARDVIIPDRNIDDPLVLSPPKLVNFDWDAGKLHLQMDQELNSLWQQSLHNLGNFTFLMGHEPVRFSVSGREVITGAAASDVQSIIDNFRSWIPGVNSDYEKVIRRRNQQRIDTERAEHKAEIDAREERLRVLQDTSI